MESEDKTFSDPEPAYLFQWTADYKIDRWPKEEGSGWEINLRAGLKAGEIKKLFSIFV